MTGAVATVRGLACLRCGGTLRATEDPERLQCSYCDTHHLHAGQGDDVAAFAPAGRIGRRRARRVLADALRERGIEGFAVEGARMAWLPFWHVRAKLVGWQVYRRPIEAVPGEAAPTAAVRHQERFEELVARDVDVTLPGCDARRWGLVGVADRLSSLRLRPLAVDREAARATVCSVIVPRASARRQAELLRSTGVVPRGAVRLRQRLSLARVRMRLIYYPVWKLRFTVAGRPGEVDVDGVRARVIQGDAIVEGVSRGPLLWHATAAAAGWVAGLHPALGALGLAAWSADRFRREVPGSCSPSAWLSRELVHRRLRRVDLGGL
ncbi:MAG TPA: hypothetical protein VKA86_06535 [Candidatus Krumholzibacteria bacterium]|nr:hypothetical protein [Candidatus Krumholzibacteria bacterium]